MAEKLPEEDGPSLELPSLFGRRKERNPGAAIPEPVAEQEPVHEPTAILPPTPPTPPVPRSARSAAL